MVLGKLRETRFWIEWEDKFESDSNTYITPLDPEVIEAASVARPEMEADDERVAKEAWRYVYENVDYVLSEEWKTPSQTLREGAGDCEDVTFLIASMLPNMGIPKSEIVLGDLVFPDGSEELHTWNRVGDTVVDATGSIQSSELATYKPRTTYTIVAE